MTFILFCSVERSYKLVQVRDISKNGYTSGFRVCNKGWPPAASCPLLAMALKPPPRITTLLHQFLLSINYLPLYKSSIGTHCNERVQRTDMRVARLL